MSFYTQFVFSVQKGNLCRKFTLYVCMYVARGVSFSGEIYGMYVGMYACIDACVAFKASPKYGGNFP